jgi:uncharacterized protein YdaU (DUF1376 family)
MGKDPAFLFYPNDWLGGTMGMTFEEKGAYISLLMMQFNRGHMSGHMIGQEVGQLWDKIKDKFIQDSQGLWYNERLDIEKANRQSFCQSRRNNINGNNQYTKKEEKEVGHMGGHTVGRMENVNEDTKITKNNNYKYSEFYDKEIDLAKNETYERFVKFLYGENELGCRLAKITKMKYQVGFEQFEKLRAKAVEKGKRLTELCLGIENNTKAYSSLYLTLNTWLNKGY